MGVPSRLQKFSETKNTTYSSHGDKDFYKEPRQGVLDVFVFDLQKIMRAFLESGTRVWEETD